ncbi:MAG TPA: TatD family deoxyribonuclease [Gammaproteobacteria bacterium]|nr:TatD family deoxyribonuclease [Gammaproteobacteria bacterium]
MLVDSHCHLDMLKLGDEPLQSVLDEARAAGVERMLCVAVNLERFPAMMEKIAPHPQVLASVGVHPDHEQGEDPDEDRLAALARDERIVAIGETGLDYYRTQGDTEWQRARFRRHIRAARAIGKPLIVHTREAREDTIAILRDEQARDAGGVLHCFTESWDMARAALDIGFYVSFSGIVTFRNATELKEVAKRVPADRMLVETDAPFLAPVPRRGKPNRPAWVRHVAEYLAELRGEDFEQLCATTTENFDRLFCPG